MAVDTKTPLSPGWWMNMLAKELERQRRRCQALDDYYSGHPPMPFGGEKWSAGFQTFMRKSRSNFAAVIVQAPRERLAVRSIRTAVEADDDGDKAAWSIWTGNDLDIVQADVYRYALAMHVGYVSVTSPAKDSETPDLPVICAEDPRQMITVHDPMTGREIAAFKMFHDPVAGRDYAYLWLPGELHVASRARTVRATSSSLPDRYNGRGDETTPVRVIWSSSSFDMDDNLAANWATKTVPVTRFLNRDGKGEFEGHIDLLDRINHMILQRLIIATLQAFRQRAIETTNEDGLPDKDDDGNPIDYEALFTSDPGALWRLPFGAKIWESAQADLNGILSAVKDDVLHLAALTATPMSMFTPDAAAQSAEGASLQREGQTFKVEDRQRIFGRRWARVMSHAFLFQRVPDPARADIAGITIEWYPAERYSLAEKGAAAAQLSAVLPKEAIWRDVMQMTPSQIALVKVEAQDEAALAQASAQLAADQAAKVAAAQAAPPPQQPTGAPPAGKAAPTPAPAPAKPSQTP